MKFNEIFNKYMNLIGCTSKELSIDANLSESIVSRYRNGLRVPNHDTIKKISKSLSKLSSNKYKEEDIFNDFIGTNNVSTINFSNVQNNLNILIDNFDIKCSVLSKYLNYDPSYLSRIRNGNRVPSNKEEFVNSLTNFILKKYSVEKYGNVYHNIFGQDIINFDNVKYWIINNSKEENKEVANFLNKLDDFDLNDYIKSIKFDELKIPTIPFYKAKTKNYYGLEEMKKAELDFFKATVLSKSKEDIFMCSDMPMEDMAKDLDFSKKWMFGVAMCLKKGFHLNIIHNLDRPFNEMMLGLESWIPIYMTGQVSPYYFKEIKNTVYQHINYSSGSVVLTGECIKNNHSKGKYYIATNLKELDYYKEKCRLILKKASSLMDIYKVENKDQYKEFLLNGVNEKKDRKRIYSSLPLFTISDKLLKSILKRNNINSDDINKILDYKHFEEKYTNELLKTNIINDVIYNVSRDNFKDNSIYLTLSNSFFEKRISYNYDEFLEHYNSTVNYKNKNYIVTQNKEKNFDNIDITIVNEDYVILSKSVNPIIHFVIRHNKLVKAIECYNPIVVIK